MKRIIKQRQSDIRTVSFHLIVLLIAMIIFLSNLEYKKSSSFNLDGISNDVVEAINEYESVNIWSSNTNLATGEYEEFLEMKTVFLKYATIQDCIKLKKYPNSLVKAAAYEYLIKTDKINASRNIIESLMDATSIFRYGSD